MRLRFSRFRHAALAALLAIAPAALAASSPSAPMPSREDAKSIRVERLRADPGAIPVGRLQLGMPDAGAIAKARRANTGAQAKKLQIGIGREVPGYPEASSNSLAWAPVPGGMAAHWEVSSPGARALRVGLRAWRLTPGVELRFAGAGEPGTVYGPYTAADLLAADGPWWSPVLQGERATLELFVPAGGATADAGLAIASVSHLFANPRDADLDAQAKVGSDVCENDLACYASNAALQNTAKAVARMTYTSGGLTYLCTGTLLNPTDGSHTAYFYSAYHCISTQQVATTLTTHWFYDRTGCDTGGTSPSYVQLTGGATLLHANATTDALLLRLNAPPPNGAWFAGWESATVAANVAFTGIHHPQGDWKKVSLAISGGVQANPATCINGSWIVANWYDGVTEGGSSGSGIFTAVGSPATDYRLRGGLWGGTSSCDAEPQYLNDCYSRFDLAYPSISGYLNPVVLVPGTFAFSSTGYAASEGLGSVVLSVVRQGGTSGTVSVGWSTADGTAVSGLDYGGGSGTLIWGAGDATAKTIVIPILADAALEAAEAFTVTLGSPTGGTAIGSPSSATVTIADAGIYPPGGAMPAGWTKSPGAQFPWEVATDSAWEGTFSLKSGLPPNSSLHHNQRADIEVTVPLGTGDVTFARRVSSQAGADALRFYVDGVEQGAWSGEAAWGPVSVPVTQGYRTLRWSYAKDGAFDAGADTAWIDAVTIPPTGLDPAGDLDGDGIPNGVEPAEWRNPFAKDNDLFSPDPASARLFAMQQYRDFLGREGDGAGITGWANAVASGAWSRPQVIDAFVGSAEFGGMVAPVVRLYFATFLRVPDHAGLVHNAGLVRSGALTLVQLAGFFAGSPEFLATYGALDNAQFVTLLYQNVLGRAPDPAGLDGWVALLEGGWSRGQVLLGFSESAEYQAARAREVYVTMMYAGMLRRSPEPLGYAGWLAFLEAGSPATAMVGGFFDSVEYRARFLP